MNKERETRTSDLGTKEFREKLIYHNLLELGYTPSNQRIIRGVPQIPLDFYIKSKSIKENEYQAGCRLYRDFYIAGLVGNVTINLNAVRSGNRKEYWPATEKQRYALTSWRDAVAAVPGETGQKMLINVCCYGFWLNDVKYDHYSKRSAMSRFKEALEALDKHYRLTV